MKLRFNPDTEKLELTETSRTEYHQLKLHLTRYAKNYKFNPRFKFGVWDGKISHFNDGKINLGLWKEIYKLCKLNDWEFHLENKEDFPVNKNIQYEDVANFCEEFFKEHKLNTGENFAPYDYQINAAFKILKNRYCLCEVATGGGKTLIFAIIIFYYMKYMNPDAKILLIVPNITLVTQFYNDLMDYNQGFNNENDNSLDVRPKEMMSDNPREHDNPNVYIGTFSSLIKYDKEWFEQFDVVATDEAHKSDNGTNSTDIKQIAKVLKNTFTHAYMRFGMSGTFPDTESLDYLTIESLHGPKSIEVTAKELMDRGIITPVEIKALILNHNDPKFNSEIQNIKKSGNGKAAFDMEKKYIHASKNRMDFIINKLLSNITKNTLVLFQIKEYGKEIYRRLREETKNIDIYYIDGDTKAEKRDYIKRKFDTKSRKAKINKIQGKENTERPKLLVASFGTLSTGVSIKNLHNMVFMESFKSKQLILQSIGRTMRLFKNKDKAIIFDIVDIFKERANKNILWNHYENRKSFYDSKGYPYQEKRIKLQ